jgi:glyoxylase-like metal-dependent hydrolase (beta-lactamase superfamily II)
MSFFLKSQSLLFSGDSLASTKDRLYSISRVSMYSWNDEKCDASFKKQAALRPLTVCSGHGGVVRNAAGKFASS